MSNLLDKASIILTPTAYNNGEALCVKPSDGSGDFDFSRNSAATRVNAQGLVENVQILSSNLVQNGDFSEEGVQEVSNGSFSQEGVQLITNGDFENGSANWNFQLGWTFDNGQAHFENLGSSNRNLWQSPLVNGNWYKLTFEITSITSGYIRNVNSSVTDDTQFSTIGVHTQYFQAANVNLYLKASVDANLSIDNVSVREVGQDWDLGTGWSIAEDKAVAVSGASSRLEQSISGLSGKTCKISFTLSDYGGGGAVYVDFGSVNSDLINTNGEHVVYGTFDQDNFELFKGAAFSGSITNISVKEVGQNWTLQTGWSIADGKASAVASTQSAYQSGITLAVGNKYLCSFEITDYTSGQIVFACGSGGLGTNRSAIGVYTEVIVAGTGNIILLDGIGGTGAFTGSITNISVIEITDDTNLPRINYEGFSYQDALGSELITNGDFATDLSGWSSITNVTWSSNFGGSAFMNAVGTNAQFRQTISYEVGKTYRISWEVKENNGCDFFRVYNNNSYTNITDNYIGTHYFDFTHTSGLNFILRNDRVGSDITIDNVSVKEYLGQEVVPDSGCGSWLWEPQSTNLITQSELFSDASWRKANAIVSDNSTISVDGTQNATLIQSTTSTSAFVAPNNLTLTIGNTYTFSCFAKKGNNDWIRLAHITSGGTGCWFDLENGVVGTVNSQSATIEDYGNGWYRCTNTFIATSATSLDNAFIGICDADGSTNAGIVGQNDYLWGAMLEALSYATSYIPTEGSTVTRNQDLCTNGGSLASINSTEGVLYAEIAALANDGTSRRISLSDGTNNNRLSMIFGSSTNNFQCFSFVNNSVQFNFNQTLSNVLQLNKIAIKYSLNNFSLFVNGVKIAEDNSGNIWALNTLNVIDFDDGTGTNNFYGKTKALAVWKEALSDSELQSLTTI